MVFCYLTVIFAGIVLISSSSASEHQVKVDELNKKINESRDKLAKIIRDVDYKDECKKKIMELKNTVEGNKRKLIDLHADLSVKEFDKKDNEQMASYMENTMKTNSEALNKVLKYTQNIAKHGGGNKKCAFKLYKSPLVEQITTNHHLNKSPLNELEEKEIVLKFLDGIVAFRENLMQKKTKECERHIELAKESLRKIENGRGTEEKEIADIEEEIMSRRLEILGLENKIKTKQSKVKKLREVKLSKAVKSLQSYDPDLKCFAKEHPDAYAEVHTLLPK